MRSQMALLIQVNSPYEFIDTASKVCLLLDHQEAGTMKTQTQTIEVLADALVFGSPVDEAQLAADIVVDGILGGQFIDEPANDDA